MANDLNDIKKTIIRQSLKLNRTAVSVANNAYDRLFDQEKLIRSGRTSFDVIAGNGLMSVRAYHPLSEDSIEMEHGDELAVEKNNFKVPLVIVPPLAANTLIFDLLPERSLVRYFLARGHRVYLIDWGEPSRKHAHLGIKDYAEDMMSEAVNAIREHADTKALSLMGWCMGGLFCLMYTGLTQDKHVKNIVTIASPIDSQKGGVGGAMIKYLVGPANLIRKYTRFRLNKIDPIRLQIPGKMNAVAFKLTNPVGSLMTYWDLIINLSDREFVSSHTTTSDFLDNMLDYPGGIVQDFVVKFGIDNALSKGEIKIGDKVAEFKGITSSILAFAGDTDALVTPSAARKSLELVSSDDKQFVVAPGGHAGVVMGGKAPSTVWSVAADWLETRSN